MIGPTCIVAGDQFFYSHPQTGTLIVGAFNTVSPGHDGRPALRTSPRVRTPETRDPAFAPSHAVEPVSHLRAPATGSHLWVG